MSWMWPFCAISSSLGIIDSGNVCFFALVWKVDPGAHLLVAGEKKKEIEYG